MNNVSLIGQVVGQIDFHENRAGILVCQMRLAVPRRAREGRPEPGVVYIDVATFDEEARRYSALLSEGSYVGISGRLDSDDPSDAPGWSGVLIDQIDLL